MFNLPVKALSSWIASYGEICFLLRLVPLNFDPFTIKKKNSTVAQYSTADIYIIFGFLLVNEGYGSSFDFGDLSFMCPSFRP